jgi:hypothetical protein
MWIIEVRTDKTKVSVFEGKRDKVLSLTRFLFENDYDFGVRTVSPYFATRLQNNISEADIHMQAREDLMRRYDLWIRTVRSK